jgi:hypothetical protein
LTTPLNINRVFGFRRRVCSGVTISYHTP